MSASQNRTYVFSVSLSVFLYPHPVLIRPQIPEKDEPDDTKSEVTNSDSPGEDGYIKCPLPRKPVFFIISRQDWNKIIKKRNTRRFIGLQWTNVIAKGLRKVFPYCSFAFKRHCLKSLGSLKTKGPHFHCQGYCHFNDCPVRFTVTVQKETYLKAEVAFQGLHTVHNRFELQSRPIRADDRIELAHSLQNKLPRALYLEKLNNIREDVIRSGWRDEAPSPHILKNISKEIRTKSRLHSNEFVSLKMMIDPNDKSPDKVLQQVSLHPKAVLKRNWDISWAVSGRHNICGCHWEHQNKGKGLPSFLCVWTSCPASKKEVLPFCCGHLHHLWPHHSVSDTFSWGFPNRCDAVLW